MEEMQICNLKAFLLVEPQPVRSNGKLTSPNLLRIRHCRNIVFNLALYQNIIQGKREELSSQNILPSNRTGELFGLHDAITEENPTEFTHSWRRHLTRQVPLAVAGSQADVRMAPSRRLETIRLVFKSWMKVWLETSLVLRKRAARVERVRSSLSLAACWFDWNMLTRAAQLDQASH
jgi:hypothetical protein